MLRRMMIDDSSTKNTRLLDREFISRSEYLDLHFFGPANVISTNFAILPSLLLFIFCRPTTTVVCRLLVWWWSLFATQAVRTVVTQTNSRLTDNVYRCALFASLHFYRLGSGSHCGNGILTNSCKLQPCNFTAVQLSSMYICIAHPPMSLMRYSSTSK